MAKIKLEQVRSIIDCPKEQRLTMEALGFHKMHSVVEHDDTPAIRGMVARVKHLVKVL